MPSQIIDSDQLEAVRADGYSAHAYLAFISNTIVFQAEVDTTPTGNVFGEVTFTNVTTGSFSDIREGQILIFSTSLSNYVDVAASDRYRVRKAPTSSIVYINEASIALNPGDVITILNSYDIRERARRLSYVDFDLSFEDLGAVFTEIDSAYGAVTTDSTFILTLAPLAIAMADGDSVPDGNYEWEFDQTPSYITGSSTDREIEVELPVAAEWGRLTVTTANGIISWFAFSLHFGDPNTDARFLMTHDPITIEASVFPTNTGYNASLDVFDNFTLSDVLDRTRCAVIVDEHYTADDDTNLGTVRFVGYVLKDASTTRGDEKYGQVKSNSIELRGLYALAGELPMSPIAVRDVNPPTQWDEIAKPTTERIIAHVLMHYSTVANLCAIVFPGFAASPDKWYASNFDIVDTSLMDAVATIGSEINGDLVSDAAGGFVFERNASFLTTDERNDLDTVIPDDMNTGDQFELQLTREHKPRVGKVEMGARVFFSNGMPSVGYTALAPAVAYGEGQERVQIPNALLPADDMDNAGTNAGLRAAYWYAFRNNLITINGSLAGAWGWASPSQAQWWPFDIAVSDTTRGVTITSDTRWLLGSIRTVINGNGTIDTQASWIPETTPGRALILVAPVPSVINTELPILPVRSAYGAFPPKASINYTSVDPTNKQRRDPFSGWQTTPWPTREAAAAALKQPTPGSAIVQVSFRNPSAVNTGFITTLGADYALHFSGYAQISTDEWQYNGNFLASDESFFPVVGIEYGTWVLGSGWLYTDALKLGFYRRSVNIQRTIASSTLTYISFLYDWTSGTTFDDHLAIGIAYNALLPLYSANNTAITNGTNKTAAWSGVQAGVTAIIFLTNANVSFANAYSGFARQISFVVRGTGTNPFDGTVPTALYSDSFYTWQLDADGNPINVTPNTAGGVRIDNNGITVFPPFNTNHEYDASLSDFNGTGGTGSVLAIKFLDGTYTDNESKLLTTTIRGTGAGQ